MALLQEENKTTETEENLNNAKKDETVQEAEVIDTELVDDSDEDTNELQQEVDQLKQENEKLKDHMLRVQAEFDNFKKRSQKEKEAERKYKSQDLANELLPVLDNFERALQVEVTDETKSLFEGITMVYRQLQDALKSQGVEEIEAEGKDFDPNLHHAVMQVEEEDKDSNIVVEVLQKGYMLKDRVIRPAMVKVNK